MPNSAAQTTKPGDPGSVMVVLEGVLVTPSLFPTLMPSLMESTASSSNIMISEKKLLPSSGYCTLTSAEWPNTPMKKQSSMQTGVLPSSET